MAFKSRLQTGELCDKCGGAGTEPTLSMTYTSGRGRGAEFHNITLHPSCFGRLVVKGRKEGAKETDGLTQVAH